jgi:hypothetical protein
MTINKIVKRLSKNSVDFLLAGELEKSNACMDLLVMIREKGFLEVKGKLSFDNV